MFYIVIPSYNSESFIDECLNSVFKQVSEDIFIVFIDDGSNDKSLELVKNRKISRMVILEKKNGGPSSARNFALDYIFKTCQSIDDSYICFIDSDDAISPFFVSEHYRILKENNADIVCSKSINNPDEYIDKTTDVLCLNNDEGLYYLFTNKIFSFSCIKLFRLSLWSNIRFPEECSNSEDVATIYKTFYLSNKIVTCGLFQYFYRDNPNSIIRKKQDNDSLISMQTAFYLRLKDVKDRFVNLINYDILVRECTISFCNTVINTTRHIDFKTLSNEQVMRFKAMMLYFDEVFKKTYFKFSIKGSVKRLIFARAKKKILDL